VPIPEEEIDAVQRLVYCTLPYDPHPSLEPGTKVRVIRGPLTDVEGVLLRKAPRMKVLISINLLHQGATVTLESEDVVAV
jgi:transcription antitermination factor NusG